jgi:hypothetical protein
VSHGDSADLYGQDAHESKETTSMVAFHDGTGGMTSIVRSHSFLKQSLFIPVLVDTPISDIYNSNSII